MQNKISDSKLLIFSLFSAAVKIKIDSKKFLYYINLLNKNGGVE